MEWLEKWVMGYYLADPTYERKHVLDHIRVVSEDIAELRADIERSLKTLKGHVEMIDEEIEDVDLRLQKSVDLVLATIYDLEDRLKED